MKQKRNCTISNNEKKHETNKTDTKEKTKGDQDPQTTMSNINKTQKLIKDRGKIREKEGVEEKEPIF